MTNCPLKMYAFLFFVLCFISLSYANYEKKISDSALTEQAKTTIQREYSSIKLATINRVVYVYGSVDSNTDMDAIIEKVASIEGVKDVDTRNLFVQGSRHPLTDAVITAKVKGLFIQKKLLGQDDSNPWIKVETVNNIVYLSGKARSANHIKRLLQSPNL